MTLTVLSLGAGVQSTTLALLVAEGELPAIDAAIFADTQWEPAAVYRHLDWLETQVPFPIHRVTQGSIVDGILARRNSEGGRFATVPWFVRNADGSKGMGRRQCSNEYKLEPIARKVRELLGVDSRARIPARAVEVWIGISRDEAQRMKPARQQYMTNRWPLVERGMTRRACLTWLGTHGYPHPPKSACIGCPFHSQSTWRRMRDEQPEEFAEACRIDAALRRGDSRGMRDEEYMHRALIPLAAAVALNDDQFELEMFGAECEGVCGV